VIISPGYAWSKLVVDRSLTSCGWPEVAWRSNDDFLSHPGSHWERLDTRHRGLSVIEGVADIAAIVDPLPA
jgi:hypothetical protein